MIEDVKIQILNCRGDFWDEERVREHLNQLKEIARKHDVVAILISADSTQYSMKELADGDQNDAVFAIRKSDLSHNFLEMIVFEEDVKNLTGIKIIAMALDHSAKFSLNLNLNEPYVDQIGPPTNMKHGLPRPPENNWL